MKKSKARVKSKFKVIILLILHGYIIPRRYELKKISRRYWFWSYAKFKTCGDKVEGYIIDKQFKGAVWGYPLWALEEIE